MASFDEVTTRAHSAFYCDRAKYLVDEPLTQIHDLLTGTEWDEETSQDIENTPHKWIWLTNSLTGRQEIFNTDLISNVAPTEGHGI